MVCRSLLEIRYKCGVVIDLNIKEKELLSPSPRCVNLLRIDSSVYSEFCSVLPVFIKWPITLSAVRKTFVLHIENREENKQLVFSGFTFLWLEVTLW